MARMLTALAVTVAAAATPAAASALAPMCSELAAPHSQEPTASAASDAAEPIPAPPVVIPRVPVVAAPAELPDLPAGDVPWCFSPDDPRCQPMHQDSAPSAFSLQAPVPALALQLEEPPARDADLRFTARDGLTKSAGHGQPVERPPRSARR